MIARERPHPPTIRPRSASSSWPFRLFEVAFWVLVLIAAWRGYEVFGWTFAAPWLIVMVTRGAVRLAAATKDTS